MTVRFIAPLIAATLSLTVVLTACEPEEELGLVGGGATTRNRKTTDPTPAPTPKDPLGGNVDQTPSQDPTPQAPGGQNPGDQKTPDPVKQDPDAPRASFELNVDAVALTAPPNSGSPLFPTSEKVEARLDGKKVTPLWSSSNAGVATVDATGRISAVGAGSTVVTAAYEGREAKVTVSVDLRSRLQVGAQDAPGDASVSWRLYDGAGALSASGLEGETVDLTKGGNLIVEARRGQSLVAVGRWNGLALYPNQVNLRKVPLNVSVLDNATPHGGVDEPLLFTGSGFTGWKRGEGAGTITYDPEIRVTISDRPAEVTYVSASQLYVRMPELSGVPAHRKVSVGVGELTLQGFVRLLGSLAISGSSSPLSVGSERQFTVRAFDTDQQEVGDPRVQWEIWADGGMGGGSGEALVGQISSMGLFHAERVGKGTIAVRSGSLLATASVTVQ
jgi:hypothetical protein